MDKAIDENIVLLGEIGLTGEVRSVSRLEYRLTEAKTLGFKEAVVPIASLNEKVKRIGLIIHSVHSVNNVFKVLF